MKLIKKTLNGLSLRLKDTANGAQGFGFICLDDIVTYYAETPDVSAMQPGGFCVRPEA